MTKKKTKQPNPKKVPLTYLNAKIYEDWSRWCEERGLVQQRFMSKIVKFIMELDDSTRTLFTREINEEERSSLAKLILGRIAIGQQALGEKLNLRDGVADGLLDEAGKPSSSEKDESESRRQTSPKRRGKAG